MMVMGGCDGGGWVLTVLRLPDVLRGYSFGEDGSEKDPKYYEKRL